MVSKNVHAKNAGGPLFVNMVNTRRYVRNVKVSESVHIIKKKRHVENVAAMLSVPMGSIDESVQTVMEVRHASLILSRTIPGAAQLATVNTKMFVLIVLQVYSQITLKQ